MTIPFTKGPVSQKNPLTTEELDDGAICLNPVQQLSEPVQEDFHYPIGQMILAYLGAPLFLISNFGMFRMHLRPLMHSKLIDSNF